MINLSLQVNYHDWLVVSTPLKNTAVSWDDDFSLWENKPVMFQENHQPDEVTIFG